MPEYELAKGRGRTRVRLLANSLGSDLVVFICNENAHIGAISLGEWDEEHGRASVSVITRLGHKDDSIAQKAAYQICKSLHRPVCVIAGIHLDDITLEEIKKISHNADLAVASFLKSNMIYSPEH
jgi:gallate decarboxylase subunit D